MAINYTDPRIIRRITKCLKFVLTDMRTNKWREIDTRTIYDYFGNTSRPASRQIFQHLLTCVDDYYNPDTGQAKTYVRNDAGIDELAALINTTRSQVLQEVVVDTQQSYEQELASGGFNYTEKNYRIYHRIQNLPRTQRNEVLSSAGYVWDYDIDSCALNLLHQFPLMSFTTDRVCVEDYLNNKDEYRQQLAQQLEMSVSSVKALLAAVLNGAHLGCDNRYRRYQMFRLLQQDPARVEFLRQDEFFVNFRTEIRQMWRDIVRAGWITRREKNGRKLPLSSQQRAMFYFRLEQQVRQCIQQFLQLTDNPHFYIHDGFVARDEIHTPELTDWIHQRLGYRLRFTVNKLGEINE